MERHATHIQQVSESALEQEFVFLPKLPEAAELARATWARGEARELPQEREEAVSSVHALNPSVPDHAVSTAD